MGRKHPLRTLNIDHHQARAGIDASIMPSAETPEAWEDQKNSPAYRVNRNHPIAAIRKDAVADAAE